MRKRKNLDSEVEQHMVVKEKHIENAADVTKETTISAMETDMEITNLPVDISLEEGSLTNNSRDSLDNTSNLLADREGGMSKSADADILKQTIETSHGSAAISNNSKQCKTFSRKKKNKKSSIDSVTQPQLTFSHGCTSGDNSSSLRTDESGSLIKVSDQTCPDNKCMSLVEKENTALTGSASTNMDDVGMRNESSITSDTDTCNYNGNKEIETKTKNAFLDFPKNSSELDGNDSSVNPSLSAAVSSDLAGKEIVKSSTEDNVVLSLDQEDNGITQRANDISNTESIVSLEVASNLYPGEGPCTDVAAHEKVPVEDLSCSPLHIEQIVEDASDAAPHAIEGGIAHNFEIVSVSEEVQTVRTKQAKHESEELNDVSAIENEDLPDEFDMVAGASSISAEGNQGALSTDGRESFSPIRGVIDEPVAIFEPNSRSLSHPVKKEDISFSFQTSDKILLSEQSDNHCEMEVVSNSGAEPVDRLRGTREKDDFTNMPSCVLIETTDGRVKEIDSSPMEDSSENVLPLDSINSHDKKPEVVILEPERNLLSRIRRKLLVLDLNGLLADIVPDPRHLYRGRKKVGGKSVFKRPFCDDFLKFCFETFDVGVWSSRRKYNVDGVLDCIMGDNKHKLLFCWDESQCTYTGSNTLDNVHKPLVLKELKKLWNKEESGLPWEKGDYSASNTLLVDDSPYKALCNPPHTAIFPRPYHFDDDTDTSLGPGGDLRVYLAGLSQAPDVRLYVQEHPFGQQAISSSDSSWGFYQQIIEKVGQSLVPIQ